MAESETAEHTGRKGTLSELYDWVMAHKWWVIGGVGGLLGLYIIYRNMAGASSSSAGGLSTTQAAVDAASLQANTAESNIAAQAQTANEAAAVQTAQIQAELQAAQAGPNASAAAAQANAQAQVSINASNDATAIQLAQIASQTTTAAPTVATGPTSQQITTAQGDFASFLTQLDAGFSAQGGYQGAYVATEGVASSPATAKLQAELAAL